MQHARFSHKSGEKGKRSPRACHVIIFPHKKRRKGKCKDTRKNRGIYRGNGAFAKREEGGESLHCQEEEAAIRLLSCVYSIRMEGGGERGTGLNKLDY